MRLLSAGVGIALLNPMQAVPFRRAAVVLGVLVLCGALACDNAELDLSRTTAVQALNPNTIAPDTLTLPGELTSVKFAVIGDSGRGNTPQREIAAQMVRFRERFPYQFVLMMGDNIYEGPASPDDYYRKFQMPYQALLDAGVKFYAVLGNHDDPREVDYEPFNMDGERYYSFAPPEDVLTKIATQVEFFAVDTTNLDRTQLRWLDERLASSDAAWKICFFHHPLYTSGRYRNTSRAYRWLLEPLLVRHGVDAAFSGHEHIYQRSEPQRGVVYFVSGGAGSLRPGDGAAAPYIARTFDTDYHFVLVEIAGNDLHFQAISREGKTVDAGTVSHKKTDEDDAEASARSEDRADPRKSLSPLP